MGTKPETKKSHRESIAEWKAKVAAFEKPSFWRASWQLGSTLGCYVALWVLMYLSLSVSWWVTIPLAILAGGVLIRVFIIFHDCGHGSFFKSQRANSFWGFLTGMLAFTPFHHWKWEHSIHHATVGDLDRRGVGDVWTLTVREYLEASRWKKFSYRLVRNPIVLFVIAPLFLFLVRERFPVAAASRREKRSVWLMNLALLCLAACLMAVFGFLPWLIIQLTVMAVAGSGGVWLFYVQHQFEDSYWEHSEDWDYTTAAMQGSSFYKLPKVLQWFSGNIGFHHIHHLSSRIPNYNLERCHRSDQFFQAVKPLTLLASLRSITFRLWDEQNKRLVSFAGMRKLQRN